MNPGPSSGEHTQQELVFIESQRGGKSLLHDGYRYNLNKTNKDSTTLWRCVNRADCSASIKLGPQRNNVRTPPTPHSCRRNKFRNEVDLIIDSCKKEVCKNYAPVKQIFEEQITKLNLHEKSKRKIIEMDMYVSKKDTLNRKRRKFLNLQKTNPLNLNDVEVPEILATDFLVWCDGDNNDKILVFCTKKSQNTIKKH